MTTTTSDHPTLPAGRRATFREIRHRLRGASWVAAVAAHNLRCARTPEDREAAERAHTEAQAALQAARAAQRTYEIETHRQRQARRNYQTQPSLPSQPSHIG